MDFEIAGISFYYIISWFFIYSFLGWVWESVYVSVKKKKLVNRGFINGPLCTIYGLGAVAVYLILKPFDENLLILYVGGVVTATVLEYITGWLMEKIFHTRWWDYSSKKYNLHGYICLGSSVAWGFFTLLLFYVLQPFVSWITDQYPVHAGRIVVAVVSALSDFPKPLEKRKTCWRSFLCICRIASCMPQKRKSGISWKAERFIRLFRARRSAMR